MVHRTRSASPFATLAAAGTLAVAVSIGLPAPAHADEIEDSITAALDAYRAGDVDLAKEELDFAAQLLAQMKAEGLAGFLPPAMSGWTREDGETQAMGAAMMGGGQTAGATYTRGSDTVDIQLVADNPMIAAMGAMFANPAAMGAMGSIKRIGREKVIVTNDGELQALVNNRILVQVSGSASVEDKTAYFEAMDIAGLKDF
ncbi:hypothetical protein [Roseospira navarrensis]|uniref:Uncharacterized protein n=1 Tax=Roseospira navarrensis TaxID=140058 RepID=A0A7X1ZEP6_9PROT|nr:hypothetical protein [Roseospira navarrensis]MQX37198.1 hypothetical protein [Roseospira navarrensis]